MRAFRSFQIWRRARVIAVVGIACFGGSVSLGLTPADAKSAAAVQLRQLQSREDVQRAMDEQACEDLKPFALDKLAADKRLDRKLLSVANAAVARFPSQGVTAFAFKIMDERDGAMHGLLIDESGLALDSDELLVGERAALQSQVGKLDSRLAERLSGTSNRAPIPVSIRLHGAPFVPPPRPEPEDPVSADERAALAEQARAARRAWVEATVAPVIDFLSARGISGKSARYSPVVHAALDPATIHAVAQLPSVVIVREGSRNEPHLDVARAVTHIDTVQSRGIYGSDVKVAAIEVGGMADLDNPYLPDATITNDATDSCVYFHSTAVSGVLKMFDFTHIGLAFGCQLRVGGSCNVDSAGNVSGTGSELQAAANRAADWGARVFNNSWGQGCTDTNRRPDDDSEFYDDFILHERATVVVSAGNRGSSCTSGGVTYAADNIVTNPAVAYNVIAVGAFDDKDTASTSDDVMASFSSYVDPYSTHSDRHKPEVVAPGVDIVTTDVSTDWLGEYDGTSLAAPMVSSLAALLIDRDSRLGEYPEALKAIIMATAWQNIEGAYRISDKDGVGGIMADRADDIAQGNNGGWLARTYSCGSAASWDVYSPYLRANKRMRVVICWDNDPDYSQYTFQPCADLDLQVISPTGSVVASSQSYDDTFEVVDFTPSTSGTYKFRVNKFRCGLSPQWLGLGWYQLP